MVGALGINQALLFTAVFALGSLLAGLGGALQVAREPANLATDLIVISDAFVVVVVGGMGSITGALSRGGHYCRGEGALYRHGHRPFRRHERQFLQNDAGRRISGDGGGADRAPLRLARTRAGHRAQRRRPRGADPCGDDGNQDRRPSGAGGVGLPAADRKQFALYAGTGRRCADRHPVRGQPAFHHGSRRDAFVRARRLFRARRLWRGVAGQGARRADGPGARCGANPGPAGRAAVRLVRGTAVGGSISRCSRWRLRRSYGRRYSSGRG